jgi:hypothetical protein
MKNPKKQSVSWGFVFSRSFFPATGKKLRLKIGEKYGVDSAQRGTTD